MNRPPCEHPFDCDRANGVADFDPDRDVAAVGRHATDALSRDIAAVRDRPDPDPARKIHLFQSPPGYGKTHLFGRVRHEQGDRVQFVFVPATPDPSRATRYAAWQVVETLFNSAGTFAPVRVHPARLLGPSFVAYFDQLPEGLRARCGDLRKSLADDPLAVFEVFGPVGDLGPYHTLADSLRRRLPEVRGRVVRAFAFGLSPAAEDARAWLRGEADQVAADRLASLHLPDESPTAADVIHGAAALLRLTGRPLVLCFDQLEEFFRGSLDGFRELTSHLMGWLQTIPNLATVLGSTDTGWRFVVENKGASSFIDRVAVHELHPLAPDEAAECVVRRMRSWDEFDRARGDGWPFDLGSVRRFAADRPARPSSGSKWNSKMTPTSPG